LADGRYNGPMPTPSETFVMNLQAAIREKREALGLSLTEAASKAKVSRMHWHRIEVGDKSPTAGMLKKIADALGVKVSTLVIAAERRA
jgi:transcriptional regulator with XRE-family HTH domain